MIVACPACGARYRVDDATVARRPRLRCADCRNEWTPTDGIDDEEAGAAAAGSGSAAGQATATTAAAPASADPKSQGSDPADDGGAVAWQPGERELAMLPRRGPAPPPVSRRRPLATAAAVLVGAVLAVAVAAGSLWLPELPPLDPQRIPLVGPTLAPVIAAATPPPAPARLRVASVRGIVTELPAGRVLDLTVTLANDGNHPVVAPEVWASLAGPAGVALRWRITVDGVSVPSHGAASFVSSATGFPREANRLSVSLMR